MMLLAVDIERVFNATFLQSHNTRLQGGAPEPYYRPALAGEHCIAYREDFVSSSLHETAHWLVAGEAKRLLPDWGYWYAPDGRTVEQQQAFQKVEVKPQALEWILHKACGLRFRVSLDNLGEGAGDGSDFKDAVFKQACCYISDGVNERTQTLYDALAAAFGGHGDIKTLMLSRQELD